MGGRVLIYPVRPGEKNEPLRYSLRSVASHLPDATVILAGHRPRWVTGVDHIPVTQRRPGRENVARILAAVCAHPDVPPEWVLMNDDFYAMAPDPPVPLVYRGPLFDLSAVWRQGWYATALARTHEVLDGRGVSDPLAYDRVHCPMPVTTAEMREALDGAGAGPVLHRSLYGNTIGGGVLGEACKVRTPRVVLPEQGWVSFNDWSWSQRPGRTVRRMFPRKCRYER